MSTLSSVELGVLGPLLVRQDAAPVTIPGAKPRAILTMLGLHGGSVVSADTLIELLWGEDPPRTAAKALQTHISSLRRALGDGFVLTEGAGWTLAESEVDASRYKVVARLGRDAATVGDTGQAVACFEEALALWRGIPELPDGRRGTSEKTRWVEGHAALAEDRADALLATGRAAEIIGDLEAAVADAPLRERRWGQLMLALYRAGRQGEALGAYQRARALLADELGVDPGPDLRKLEAAIVAQDAALEIAAAQRLPSVTRAVTFLLTDIEGSTAAWEAEADAMAVALARHDELVEQVVTSRGGRLIKTRGEGDATFSVFERPSAAAAAAIELQDAIVHEPWTMREPIRIRVALHTGEVELRDGDYFGRAVNRAARLRSLAVGGQILCSGATAELVIDSLPDDVMLADLGLRELRNLARPEHVFELRLETAEDGAQPPPSDAPMERPGLPSVLIGTGPFVGRGTELERLLSAWQTALGGGARAVLIAGEPGVGKTRLAGEWSRQAYEQGAVVLYGRCDEDLGAPYQPFAEALRSLVPCVGTSRLRRLRGVEALLPLVPGLVDIVPDLAAPTRADPDTERYALFDAVVALLETASTEAPVVLVLDDLHWAAKPTLLLLRHLLRFGDHARVQIIGTYRSTDLDRSHPLAAMLADLHRDGSANRISLSGLDEDDVSAYVAKAGYDDEELGHALASVTGGNPFFLIEALRHVDESGGVWDPSTLPQGVREAVSRRLSRLPIETNKALAAAAVVGSRFALDLVERVVGDDLVDAFDEAAKAGIVIEEPGGRYRFNHAIVRQSLLAELPSVRRMRLHQRIATTLEDEPGSDDELLAELAHHYFECAWAGNAAKAVEYCRRAADQAMARLAYEGAADLYDHALHALEELDDELPDRGDQVADLLVARCEALLAAGDVASAAGAVSQLQQATVDSARLAAWATCFEGELSILIHPERLDDVEAALGAAAGKLAELNDAAGEAKAHTVRAACLARLGRIGDCEIALDDALSAARRAREHRRVNAVLAGAPLAALWGPNPVPRAGGRCLDVVRLLRITTDSPAVEATSTRCQAVLEAFRGRAAASRRMIDSARRTVTELGLRHALLEVEQFAGIVELVLDDPAEAEPHLRRAYNGFRRMGLDADTAETAALLGRACLALNRDAEADELCTESERLAGHALKPSIAWRTLRAHLLSRGNDHDEARRVAEAAVTLAERTDLLVDHGDACASLATVLGAAGDAAGARAAAERAATLYERKGAAALAEKARHIFGGRVQPSASAPPEKPIVELDNECVRTIRRLDAALDREAWDEYAALYATDVVVESRRKIVGVDLATDKWPSLARRLVESGTMHRHVGLAVRGERLALFRVAVGTEDVSPGAPNDEVVGLYGLDEEGRIRLAVWFDVEDMDAALAELDATHARFEEVHSRAPLENAATRINDRVGELFATSRWDQVGALFADDVRVDDRRRGLQRKSNDHATEVANLRAVAEMGIINISATPLALRGNRLCLSHVTFRGRDEFGTETLAITEIDDGSIVTMIAFDPDDFDAALGELDARYRAGEAAPHAHTWSAVTNCYAAVNRREIPATTTNFVDIDHRKGTPFAPGDVKAYTRAAWSQIPDISFRIETVHQLSDLGAVITHTLRGTSREGFEAEWREIHLMTVEGDLFTRSELFDEADIHAALAKFDQLSRPTPRLENAATQVYERLNSYFAARDWAAMAEILAGDVSTDDRRRVVNAGLRTGRDAVIAEISGFAEIGVTDVAADIIATRGRHLALSRSQSLGRTQPVDAFQAEAIHVIEIDAYQRIVAVVVFDLDDFDAAIAELDARYLAGEAAAHARTWSVIMQGFASLNRRELPPTTPDWVNIDHRRGTSIAPGEMPALLGAAWNVTSHLSSFIETVHRLNNLGAVVTHMSHETSQDGFHAEWRVISLLTLNGDLVNRCEVFDETDMDAAIARFDQLSQPAPRLENAASQAVERYSAHFAARDWDALAKVLADDISIDDRRRVVSAGIRRGRDAEIANLRATADAGFMYITSVVIAARGERLILTRTAGRDRGSEEFLSDALGVVEINSHNQIAAIVIFDLDDFDAAIAELDARYLAGEAAAHSRTWSVIARAYAALNRHDFPATAPDWVNIDHRGETAFGPDDLLAYIRAGLDVDQDVKTYVEAVHRLSHLGAVVTYAAHETSKEGFDAEWRGVTMLTVEGEMINRSEVFDEADLDIAIATFVQLSRPAPRLENAASQVAERFLAHFAAGDWGAMAEILADEYSSDDRRRVVGAGVRHGRDAQIMDMRATADLWTTTLTTTVMATRGERLVLLRVIADRDEGPEAFLTEVLGILEINDDERMVALVSFDANDIDAAFAELDARYLAGEAAAQSHTWSAVLGAYAAINRHELPKLMPDWVNIDHRRGAAFATGDMTAYIHDLWDDAPDIYFHVEAVHLLSDLGAVVTHKGCGTSREGFDAEWREVMLFTADGDSFSRCEVFDEADVDGAIARFDQLRQPVPRLENTASQAYERLQACFAARDWDAMAETLVDEAFHDDRRRVVGAGLRGGRDVVVADLSALAEIGVKRITSDTIATRGSRLVLGRSRASGRDQRADAFRTDVLIIVELDADERIAALITFDPDDFDAAITELDTRYIGGEAAAYSHTWSVLAGAFAAINTHELPKLTPDWVNIDHRRGAAFATGDMTAYIHASWDDAPDLQVFIESVHRLSNLGAVITQAAHGTSQHGFEAEWREKAIFTFDGDLLSRCEIFDEADLDAALAKFEEVSRPTPRLDNAAAQAYERLRAHFAAGDWEAMTAMLASDAISDDRRRTANAGTRRGPEAAIQDAHAMTDLGFTNVTSTVIAIRGGRLVLMRARYLGPDRGAAAFYTEVLNLVEIDVDDRIVGRVWFDPDDFEAAIAELDARYLAGEAAAHKHTWSVITRGNTATNRHETLPTTPDCLTIDHRLRATLDAGGLAAYLRASWDLTPDLQVFIESVHRLSDLGAVVTHTSRGTSHEDFDAEWRQITLLTVEGDLGNRCEIFDEGDLDAALSKFEQLSRPAPRLENAASQVTQRFLGNFAQGNWDAIAETLADDFCQDDRRRVVGAGVRHGRDAQIVDMRAIADLRITNETSTVMATRGEHLVLVRCRFAFRDEGPEAFVGELLGIAEINADARIVADVSFDLDDIDAAFAELDARYLAGEAAPFSRTWSVIVQAYTAVNQHELPPTTPDWVNIDHRRGIAFAPGDMTAYIRAGKDLTPDTRIHIETVHRLSSLGAVVTLVMKGASREGFDAEWQEIGILTVEGDLINRCELFDEADIDAALAHFEELHPRARRLENAASRVYDRFQACFAARDWVTISEMLADDVFTEDRRRVVNFGLRSGRDAVISEITALSDVGVKYVTSDIIATRGEHLVLSRTRSSGRDQRPEAFHTVDLDILEINAAGQAVARVVFDLNDIDAAIAELDARYLAGEAAAHAHIWSVITKAYATINKHELPKTSDWLTVDHRARATFEGGDLTAYIRAGWDLTPDMKVYIEAVHRLGDLGAVVTHCAYGSSPEGFDAEWRQVILLTFEGDLINRCELFDEEDIDAALARFDELQPQARRLENAASRLDERLLAYFGGCQFDAIAEILADDSFVDDRRRIVNAGLWQGRDAVISNMRALAGGANTTSTVIAIRGERLALARIYFANRDPHHGDFGLDMLSIAEIDADNQIAAHIVFDPDDLDAAFAELDARYLAGEAATHAQAWSVIARECAAFNRHELPAADWVTIDHRLLVTADTSDLPALIRAVWDLTPDLSTHVEAVHRLSSFGAVITRTARGTSQEGFDAEWRMIQVLTVESDRINRLEMFDETDLDAALARFEELQPQVRRLENAASQLIERFQAYFAARNWAAIAENSADEIFTDDRRSVVSSGILRGRDLDFANIRATADLGAAYLTSTVIATRGQRLALARFRLSGRDQRPEAFHTEVLGIVEIDADNRVTARILFDFDDIDAAFAELDARYLAGEAAAHSHTWSVNSALCAGFNRHELPATTPDWVYIDHRPLVTIEASDLPASIRAAWDLTPDMSIYMEAVHRLTDLGAVVTSAVYGTSQHGFNAEWRMIDLFTVDGDLINRCEIFDEADLDAALARFEELHPPTRRLENAASRADDRFFAYFSARNWEALAEILADESFLDDRRPVVNAGRWDGCDVVITNMQALAEGAADVTSVIATRGERLALSRIRSSNRDPRQGEFDVEMLNIVEIDTEGRIAAHVEYDPDDIDAAFAELDARYLAGEAAGHARTWSAVMRAYTELNRGELPTTTPDFEDIDHRRAAAMAPGELIEYLRAALDQTPELSIYIEAVHLLSDRGAIVTHAAHGTSREGFDAEWREVSLVTAGGDTLNRCELFDETDLDAALARFDELDRQASSVEQVSAPDNEGPPGS